MTSSGSRRLDVGVEARPARRTRRCGSRARTWPGSRSPRSAPGGCGRPASSFSSVMRAISRRTPSKPERMTAFGVSSMMKSTPVRCSSARMLRPSRPMMRPFMSSAGSWTTDTVVSAAWPAASRCMHDGEDVAHAPVGVALGLLLDLAHEPRASRGATWSSSSLSRSCLACEALRPGDALELAARGARAPSASSARWRSSSSLLAARRARRRARRAPPPWRAGAPRGAPISAPALLESASTLAAGDAARPATAARRGAPRPAERVARAARAATRPRPATPPDPAPPPTAAITISIVVSSPRRAGRGAGPCSRILLGAPDRAVPRHRAKRRA